MIGVEADQVVPDQRVGMLEKLFQTFGISMTYYLIRIKITSYC